MPAITASMVAELRAKTDAPMMECLSVSYTHLDVYKRQDKTRPRQDGHPGRLRCIKRLGGVGWQTRGLPEQTYLHAAACLVQPARGHETIAAVVAGARPDLDAGSMGCDCLRQSRNGQPGACHQGCLLYTSTSQALRQPAPP